MITHTRGSILVLCWIISFATLAVAQSAASNGQATSVLQAALRAHNGLANRPLDAFGIGILTQDSRPPETFRFYIKGAQQLRYEYGDGNSRRVFISKADKAAGGPDGKLKFIEDHAGIRRPTLLPFFDLLEDAGNPALATSYHGMISLGSARVHHISIKAKDKTPDVRLLGRPLDEEVDLFIDSATFLVLRSVRHRSAENNLDLRVPSVLDFLDYRQVQGFQVPFRIVNTIGSAHLGMNQTILVIQNITFNGSVSDSLFEPR